MPLLCKYYSVDYLSYSIMLTTIFKALVKQGHFDKVVKIINVLDDKLVISGYESITQIKTKTLNSIFEKLLKRGELDQARLCAHMMLNETDKTAALIKIAAP